MVCSTNLITKDSRPFLVIKSQWARKKNPYIFHFPCALFIYSFITPFIMLVTETALTISFSFLASI